MGMQRLGPKKRRRLERLTGRKVEIAKVGGGLPHGWAKVWFEGEVYTMSDGPPFVNYHTGEVEQQTTREYSTPKGQRKVEHFGDVCVTTYE